MRDLNRTLHFLRQQDKLERAFARMGFVSLSFQVLRHVNHGPKRKVHFTFGIIPPALFFNGWNRLWRYFGKSEMVSMQADLEFALAFMRKHKRGRIIYDIQMRLDMYESAIGTVPGSLRLVRTWPKVGGILNLALAVLNACWTKPEHLLTHPKYSRTGMMTLKEQLLVQKRLIVQCSEKLARFR
jgi:hypothetical protein